MTAVIFTALCIMPGAMYAQDKRPDNAATVQGQGQTEAQVSQQAPSEDQPAQADRKAAPETAVPVQQSEPEAASAESAQPAQVVDPGSITVNFKGADIRTVLAYISEVAGVDIVPAPDVKGEVDLKLTNKPWKTALDIILRNYGFAYEREGDIIRVVTVDRLKQEELATQTFSLNYGKSKDVVAAIKDIVSERGKVMYDDRTNIVLVTDIPTNLYKIGQVIDKLDKKTDQVLIEARIIETVLDDSEKLGIDWNIKMTVAGAKRPTTLPFSQWDTTSSKYPGWQSLLPQVLTSSPQTATATAGGGSTTTEASEFPSGAGGISSFPFAGTDQFSYGTLDFSEFKAVLEMIKQRANTDIVSNPRIATLNNSEALINVGQTLNLPKYERNSTTGKMEITGYEAKDLGIILKVTPHINQKAEIVIDLSPQISDLLRYDTLDRASGVVAPVYSTRIAKTQVMIKDGDTIFIGGLIKENDIDRKNKMPFVGDLLGDVPYLGLLFTKKETVKQKTELIFFITVNLMAADKVIKNIPQAATAYTPQYTLTEESAKPSKKKVKGYRK
jgi:type IV pilus assembly protein PilQ